MYMKAGTWLVQHGPKVIKHAAKHVRHKKKRAKAKKAKSKQTQKVYDQYGGHDYWVPDPAKVTESNSLAANVSTRSLTNVPVIKVTKTPNVEGTRNRDHVYISGVRLRMEIVNNLTTAIHGNIAVVSNKYCDGTAPDADYLFRGLDSNTSNARHTGFDVALSSLDLNSLSLNADRFQVYFHKKFHLGEKEAVSPATTGTTTQLTDSYMLVDQYIRIKKDVRFEPGQTTPVTGQVYLLYWYDAVGSPPGTPTTANAVYTVTKTNLYFRDNV